MTLRKIARMGHPVLLAPARPIEDPTAPWVERLAADMVETMDDAGGIGLAAPQVHESVRLIVVLPLAGREAPRPLVPWILVNPEVEPLGAAVEEGLEGCLSIPGIRGVVPRARRVAWRATGLDGRTLSGEAEGLVARILQHELDHLDGILFPMRMTDLGSLAFESELARRAAGPVDGERN